jgi:hypothetical protein
MSSTSWRQIARPAGGRSVEPGKKLENFSELFRRHAAAGVGHLDRQVAGVDAARGPAREA